MPMQQYSAFQFGKQLVKHILKGDFRILKQVVYYSSWKDSFSPGRSTMADHVPWLTFPAIDFLEKHIKENARVFEYGGGGSSLFFLKKAEKVVTVEHDPAWFDLLKKNIPDNRFCNWEGRLLLPEHPVDSTGLDQSKPDNYFSGVMAFQNATFRAYATSIDNFPDEYFDVVLVDGRARASCLHHAVGKVKNGGYLILDNAERKYYLKHNASLLQDKYRIVLSEMAAVPYDPCFSRTIIWQRFA